MFVLYEAMQKTRDFDNKHALFCDKDYGYIIVKTKKMSSNIARGYISRAGIINHCQT